jgi:hypothetical protein
MRLIRYRGGKQMTLGRLTVLVGIALLVLVANVAISIVYMVVYGHVIDPGHERVYYQEHIKIAAPYCSIVAGVPLMFLAGWWVGGFWGGRLKVQSGIIVWLAYAVIDLAILAASGMTARIGVLFAVSFLTKLAAVYFGTLVVGRRP